MSVHFTIVLSPAELRIVGRALRGALRNEERAEAVALQEKMMRERAKQADQFAEEAAKAVVNIEEANPRTGQ